MSKGLLMCPATLLKIKCSAVIVFYVINPQYMRWKGYGSHFSVSVHVHACVCMCLSVCALINLKN